MAWAIPPDAGIAIISDGKLVWSGVSQTTNPKDTQKLPADTAKAVRGVMRKYGFIA